MTPLVLLLLVLPVLSSAATCDPADHAALLSFRSALSDPSNQIFSTWSTTNCCKAWSGVTCDPTNNRVADISLRPSSSLHVLSGKLSLSLCSLSHLTSLILPDFKSISGPIPTCLPSSLRHLDLIGNRLSGPIPSLSNLTSLTVLNLADNILSGPIPNSLTSLTDLRHLDLSNNLLTSPIPDSSPTSRSSPALSSPVTGSPAPLQ